MPTDAPPITPDVLSNLRAGDEQALERVFHEQYALLTAEANAVLNEPAIAAKTVESAFARVWRDREKFTSPEELQKFLHSCVHDGAVHRQSRRAVVHHDAAPGKKHAPHAAPPVDVAWAQIHAALHAETHSAEEIAREMSEHSRHATASHVAEMGKRPSWIIPVVGVVVVAGVVFGAVKMADRATADTAVGQAIDANDAHLLQTGNGQMGEVRLDDGSTVRIGAETKIRVASGFNKTVRAVGIDGSATFTVAPGQSLPFIVRAKNAMITATGTAFTVRAYATDSVVTVKVRDGHVTVKSTETKALDAPHDLAVAPDGSTAEPSATALDEAVGWADGFVVFDKTPLKRVLAQMKRWYGKEIYVKDTSLFSRTVTMKASMESMPDAIAAVESTAGLKFGYEGQTMVFRDTAGLPKTPAKSTKK
ncbi:MAG: FecR domain-containing protein [Gemmatimonadaceae bacterium]